MAEALVRLSGWGRTAATYARLRTPSRADDVRAAVAGARPAGVLARGLGRSYGDAGQNAGGDVLSTLALDDVHVDPAHGTAVVGAGCSLDALLRRTVPLGWFVPVTPGTRHVTLGGAVAADVHGKNHHVDGAFAQHLDWVDLVDGAGALRTLTPDAPEFWATAGGMGLTGVVVRARVRLRPVTSSWMHVDTERAGDLDTLMARLREHDGRFRYTVAWVDLLARGRHLGRGVLTSGDHAPGEAVCGADPLAYAPGTRLGVPPLPVGAVTPLTVRAFNEAWYRRAPRVEHAALQPLQAFFHPLDGVRDWNRCYGPAGFLQYQFVVPDDRHDVVRRSVELLQAAGVPTFLAVLKRFGPGDPGPISFPRRGWTLAMDLPAARPERLAPALDRLDELVAEAGGAIYLAKDARCRPDLLPLMYPRLDEWRDVRERMDPRGVFASDLSRRLGL